MKQCQNCFVLFCFAKRIPASHSPEVLASHQLNFTNWKPPHGRIAKTLVQREDSVLIPIWIFSLPVEPASNSLRLLIVWKGIIFSIIFFYLLHSSLQQQPLVGTTFLFSVCRRRLLLLSQYKDAHWLTAEMFILGALNWSFSRWMSKSSYGRFQQ